MSTDDGTPPPPGLRFNDIRDDYDDEFGIVRTPEEIARRRLLIPAVAYTLIGVLTGLLASLFLFWSLYVTIRHGLRRDHWINEMVLGVMAGSLAGVVWSALIVAGGISLLRHFSYRLAIIGSIAVIALGAVSCYGGILAFPFGFFALILLVRPEARSLYSQSPMDLTPESVRRRLRIPSLAILWIGLLLIPASLFGGVMLAIYPFHNHVNDLEMIGIVVGCILTPFVAAAMGWVARAGSHMSHLRRRKSAFVAAYFVASLALVPGWGIPAFPFGVWALVWLHHPDVRRFFDRPEITPGDPK